MCVVLLPAAGVRCMADYWAVLPAIAPNSSSSTAWRTAQKGSFGLWAGSGTRKAPRTSAWGIGGCCALAAGDGGTPGCAWPGRGAAVGYELETGGGGGGVRWSCGNCGGCVCCGGVARGPAGGTWAPGRSGGCATNAGGAPGVGAAATAVLGGSGLGAEPGVPETAVGRPLATIWAGRAGAGVTGTAEVLAACCCAGGA